MPKVLLISSNPVFAADLKEQITLNCSGFEVYLEDDGNTVFDIIASEDTSLRADLSIKRPLALEEFLDELKSCREDSVLIFNKYELDLNTKEILNTRNNETIKLTEKEVSILKYLYKAHGRTVSKEDLLKDVWGYNIETSTHTIETHIYRLRQKIEQDNPNQQIIETADGGYRLV